MFQMAPLAPSRALGEEYSRGGLGDTLLSILATSLGGKGWLHKFAQSIELHKRKGGTECLGCWYWCCFFI